MFDFAFTHTCYRVLNLEKSIEFYQKAFGLEVVNKKDVPESKFTLVYLSDKPRNHEIELTYNYDQEKPYEMGTGYSHVAFNVTEIEKAHEYHKSLGYTVTDIYSISENESKIYFVTDPDGYKLEVIEN